MTDGPVMSDIGRYSIVPLWLVESGISPGALHLFVLLGVYADRDGECWPSRATLAARSGCSADTIDRRLRELQNAGAVHVERRWTDHGDPTSNRYTLRFVRLGTLTDAPTGSPTDAATPSRTDAALTTTKIETTPEELALHLDGPAAATPPDPLDRFEDFWKAYPRRTAKGTARKAWPAAVRAAGSPQVIVTGAERFATECATAKREPKFIPHPATWLRAERWGDEPEAAPRPPGARAITTDRTAPEGRITL